MGGANAKKREVKEKVMMDDDEATTAISEFMKSQNRPYSV